MRGTRNLALLTFLLGMTWGFPFQVKNVEESGFITEQLGKIRMFDESWKIVAYINMSDYLTELGRLRYYESKIEDLCEKLNEHTTKSCTLIPEQLKLIIKDIESLSHLFPTKQQRRRRGVVNFVGEIQSILFGTLAQSDGKYFNEQIERLSQNQKHQNALMKKQTSIIKSSIESQKEIVLTQIKQNMIFLPKVDQLSKATGQLLSKVNDHFQWVEKTQQLDELIMYVIMLAHKCKERFQRLIIFQF